MKSVKTLVVTSIIIFAICLSCNAMAGQGKTSKALKVVKAWITLVDNGEYGTSWDKAALYFKKSIKKDKWEKMLTSARKPLGKVNTRKLQSKTYKTFLPDAPKGEYVVILFETSFKNKESKKEVITAMLDKDGQWRVAGYYIK